MIGKRTTAPSSLLRIRAGSVEEQISSRGQKYIGPVSYDFGLVEVRAGDKWEPHPDFPSIEQSGLQSFDIELISNVIPFTLRSHLSCYNGKTKFCERAHRSDDSIGVAMRRKEDGERVPVECNPEKCRFRRLHLANEDERAEILDQIKRQEMVSFPWIKAAAMPCKADVFLLFALLLPNGEYAHAPLDMCVFHTTSDMSAGRFREVLETLWRQCHFELTGLRLKLVYEPFKSRMGNMTAAWNLRLPEDVSFEVQRLQAAERRKLQNLDYNALAGSVPTSALATLSAEKSLAAVARESGVELAELVRKELDDSADRRKFDQEYINPAECPLVNQHPAVKAMCDRLEIDYSQRIKASMTFGNDVYRCMDWLRRVAKRNDIYADDIWLAYQDTLPRATDEVVEPLAEAAPEPEVEDAEFEEVIEEPKPEPRTLDEIQDAARGK